MAFTSFTLRKTAVGLGSYLRSNGREDNSLRADGISSVVLSETGESTFSANIIDPETIRLEWQLGTNLVFESDTVGASVASPVALVITSSTTGEPVTISDGSVVVTVTASTGFTQYDDAPETLPGRWVYYSLFVKYQAGSDYWYNREATLYIQLPVQYGSLDSMWSHVPMYYQILDEQQSALESGYTPLRGFLELFGNEIDRTRTLIDSVALSNDPNIAVTPALERLAYQTGLEINVDELGTTKARSLLNNIGTLRQRKGTIGNIISYISSMTGCGASYEYAPQLNPLVPHIFHINAQRINFISDPRFQETPSGVVLTDTMGTAQRIAISSDTWGVVGRATTSFTNTDITVTNINNGINITLSPSWAGAYATVMVFPQAGFPYNSNTTYYCSFDTSASAGASFNSVHTISSVDAVFLDTAPSSLVFPSSYNDDGWDNVSTMPTDTPQRRVLQYGAYADAGFETLDSVPVLEFHMTPGSSIYVGRWLWEPSFLGDYFDGSTRDGGYIPSTSGVAGEGVFDYFWGDGGVNADYSYYLLDRQRTIETTERVLAQYVIPVTMLPSYSLDWNYYIGKT